MALAQALGEDEDTVLEYPLFEDDVECNDLAVFIEHCKDAGIDTKKKSIDQLKDELRNVIKRAHNLQNVTSTNKVTLSSFPCAIERFQLSQLFVMENLSYFCHIWISSLTLVQPCADFS